jgi:hypothetical protein
VPGIQFFGKYRGTVVNTVDPLGIGRVQVDVPGAGGLSAIWAMPCFPVTGEPVSVGVGGLPPIDARVWVEFEAGDPSYPIWTGRFYSSPDEVPTGGGSSPTLRLETTGGASIVIDDTGIVIDNGQGARITLRGPTVSVNEGALEVS